MRNIVAAVGLIALGASGVQAADTAASGGQPSKPWTISLGLRGYYDDNINTSPVKVGSFGFEVTPSVLLNWTLEQTTINLGYVYTLKYYGVKPIGNTGNYDQNQTFNASVNHQFTERLRANVTDSFAVGQEPDQLRTGYAFDTFQRVSGNNIINNGTVNLDAQITRLFEVEVGYANVFVDYENKGASVGSPVASGPNVLYPVFPSTGGTLNRLGNSVHLDARYQLQPQTVGVLGYMYRQVDYTAGEVIGGYVINTNQPVTPNNTAFAATSSSRNARANFLYVGADQTFSPDLTGNIRAGASYTDFYNDPTGSTALSPYVVLSVRYLYATGSFVEGGFTYGLTATDQTGFTVVGGQPSVTTSTATAVVYGSLTQRLSPRMHANLLGQIQNSTFQGGSINGESQLYYMVGLNLEYQVTRRIAANVGYNFDDLVSDIAGQSYNRNRVYIGVTASY